MRRDYSNLRQKKILLVPKEIIINSSLSQPKSPRPDFLILKIETNEILIIEVKAGFVFDTKKSTSENVNLKKYQNIISKKVSYKTSIFICCFGSEDKNEIKNGLKNKFELENIMTGKELCQILNIRYEKILEKKKNAANHNIDFFVKELIKIPEIKIKLNEFLNNNHTK